jgi:hypothetical protein
MTEPARTALQNVGARLLRTEFETWCRSETCGHHSHDAGQVWEFWAVPDGAATTDDLPVLVTERSEAFGKESLRTWTPLVQLGDVVLAEFTEDHWASQTVVF